MHILIRDKRTGAEDWVPLEQAAALMGIAANEIEWALEEFGELESGNYVAIEPE